VYEEDHGVDVTTVDGGGAAGGLAGGLAAVGADVVPGFELVAEELNLDERIEGADLVITGEGFLDAQSFEGKVVGGVAGLAGAMRVPLLVVAGDVLDGLPAELEAVSLTERFGGERSRLETLACIEEVVTTHLG
jgi:glycerate kinase